MAQVDFSNANIQIIGSRKPLRQPFLGLTNYDSATSITYFMTTAEPWVDLGTPTITILTDTPTKYSIQYTGTFSSSTPSGLSEFGIYIRQQSYSPAYDFYWKVSNITFSAGDTYSFVVDVDVIGS